MQRTIALAVLVLAGVALAVLITVRGSTLFSPQAGDPADPGEDEPVAVRPAQFQSWPKPAAVLVLSGEAHGYLEPCGCSEKQSGGVARRSDLIKQLRDKGWPVAGLDLGGTVKRTRKQEEFKFAAMTSALRKLDYRGLGLGPEELRLQPAFLISANDAPVEEGSAGLTFLGANETFFGTPEMEGGPQKLVTFELGGVKIGAAMVLGQAKQRGIFPEGAAADVTFTPPAEALADVVQRLEGAGTQVNVLLSYADLNESRELVRQFPQFQFVVSAGGPEDPTAPPEKIGESLLVTVGHKGKYAGILALYPDDEKQPLRYELVDLDQERFKHDPAMDEVMREYQATLVDNLPDVFADLGEDFPPREGTYVGAKKCGECHKKAFAKWSTTGHAKAYTSLTTGREDYKKEGLEWVERTHDPECLSCHVTGWNPQEVVPYTSGFLPKELAAETGEGHRFDLLKGQQCENCHGPGSKHVEVMTRWKADNSSVSESDQIAAKALMKQTASEKLCIQCHDYENSPDFKFSEYWPKIAHPGKD
jgi:Cytochrome c554 and c-prime